MICIEFEPELEKFREIEALLSERNLQRKKTKSSLYYSTSHTGETGFERFDYTPFAHFNGRIRELADEMGLEHESIPESDYVSV